MEKERTARGKKLTAAERERDDLSKDKAQLVKAQHVLREAKESRLARLAKQAKMLASRQKELEKLSGARRVDQKGDAQGASVQHGCRGAIQKLETEVTRLGEEKSGGEKERTALVKKLTAAERERHDL